MPSWAIYGRAQRLGGGPPSGSALDPATDAWVAAVIANGGSVSVARKTLVDNFIRGLKADGIFAKLDRLWLHAAENQPSALTDLVADTLATAVNTPTFTVDVGYKFNGSTNYIDPLYNPTTNGVHFLQDSAHVSAWETINNTVANGVLIGGFDAGPPAQTIIQYDGSGGQAIYRVNDQVISTAIPNVTPGLLTTTRTGATARALYKNGSVIDSDAGASVSLINTTMFIGARSNSGTLSSPSDTQLASASIGGGLTASDNTNFYNRLRTYMTAVGVP